MRPQVSVIIPVYNVEKYVRRCLKSIENQTYRNLEIIVVNDGSTDDSERICREEESQDSRIHVISKINEGAGYARNTGMDNASGDYFLFVDSDDYLMNTCVERLIEVVEKEKCDIVKFKWQCGEEEEYCIIPKKKNYKIYDNHQAFRTREVDICVWGKLIKRDIMTDIRYPKESTHDDEFLTYRIIYAANKIAVLDEIYYYYYMSPGSIMRSVKNEMPTAFFRAYKERIEYFEQRNEKELADISCKEFAIRLMLMYLAYDNYQSRQYTKDQILKLFRRYYRGGKHTAHGIKEKISLLLFSIAPHMCSRLFKLAMKG